MFLNPSTSLRLQGWHSNPATFFFTWTISPTSKLVSPLLSSLYHCFPPISPPLWGQTIFKKYKFDCDTLCLKPFHDLPLFPGWSLHSSPQPRRPCVICPFQFHQLPSPHFSLSPAIVPTTKPFYLLFPLPGKPFPLSFQQSDVCASLEIQLSCCFLWENLPDWVKYL